MQWRDSERVYLTQFSEEDAKEFCLLVDSVKVETNSSMSAKQMSKVLKGEHESEKEEDLQDELPPYSPRLKNVENLRPPLQEPLPPASSLKGRRESKKSSKNLQAEKEKEEKKESKNPFRAFTVAMRKKKEESKTKSTTKMVKKKRNSLEDKHKSVGLKAKFDGILDFSGQGLSATPFVDQSIGEIKILGLHKNKLKELPSSLGISIVFFFKIFLIPLFFPKLKLRRLLDWE